MFCRNCMVLDAKRFFGREFILGNGDLRFVISIFSDQQHAIPTRLA